jgi:putative ABC transport system permease protein
MDVEVLRREARDVRYIAAVNSRMMRTVVGSNNRSTLVSGVTPEYFDIRDWRVVEGRGLSNEDERQGAEVCLVGLTVQNELFSGQSAVGQEMRLHSLTCKVVGLLESKGASAFGTDQDDVVFLPYATFSRRIIGTERISVILASAVSEDRTDDAKDELLSILRRRRHILPGEENDFGIRDPRELLTLLKKVTGMLTTLLAGVAAISLLVGGIGIMNIMLVSVTERTREVGVRLAVGARSRDILNQFLVEATVLSTMGGLLGIAAGLFASYGLARAINLPFVVPVFATAIAVAVSVLVGIGFGVFPARKAARLNPLTALRFE